MMEHPQQTRFSLSAPVAPFVVQGVDVAEPNTEYTVEQKGIWLDDRWIVLSRKVTFKNEQVPG